jgi:hypothetical protein
MTSNNVYEIHRYQHDNFQYVVARTNKYTEEQVRRDIDRIYVRYDKATRKEESERKRTRRTTIIFNSWLIR